MDRRSWPWRRKSISDKAPAPNETESSASCPSESLTDQQDTLKSSPKSPEVASKEAQPQDSSNVEVKVLSERLSSVVSDIRAKDDLVKQHSKVAEEAVLGWEKAQNEMASLKNQLNAATVKNSSLDGALKECVRQLRRAKEEQDQKVQGALALQSRQWESDKTDLELRIVELKAQLEAKSERSVTSDGDASSRLAALEKEKSALKAQLLAKSERDGELAALEKEKSALKAQLEAKSERDGELAALEKEKSALKAQLLAKTEELGLRTIEKELNRRAAEAASKQHLESIRKAAKLEAECRKLQATARRPSFSSDLRRTPSSLCAAESVSVTETDCQSGSWASALIADQYKTETRSGSLATAVDMGMNMMDDFLEMEKLASANGRSNYAEDTGGQLVKLEEKARKLAADKDKDKALHELRSCRHQERSAEMQRQLNLVNGEREAAERNKRNDLEGRLELAHGEINNLLDKGRILEERLDSEKALTLELAAKYQHMDALESETKHLRAQLQSDARKYSDKITLLERRLTEECRAVQALQAKIKGADIELELAQQEIVSFQKKVRSLEQQHKSLSVESAKRCHDLQAERNELTSQLQAVNSHVFALNNKVNMLQETLEKQGPLVAQLESQLKSAQAEIKGLKENARLLEMKLETQKNLASAYITALDASETHKNEMTNRFKLKEKEAEESHRKIYLLEEQILKERAESSEYASQCHDLKQELCSRASGHQPKPMASTDLHITKEKELVRAAGKLADCQKTIASLSAQLRTLSDFDGFIPGVENHDIALAESWDGDLKLFDSASYPAQLGCLAVT
ncbi:filament-like plant protein isoform X1 [Hordeum vulgare subsp. vulgare]|uniref:Filament-like plant protein 3 n=2 Tax=Hordeum vulgare subsp. vulgare TaxID=112509 RepID=A0A8I6XFU3_HORVV|nr:filament-like plant protein isoform X1 [Hordeum vulgare subsp. vulgare]